MDLILAVSFFLCLFILIIYGLVVNVALSEGAKEAMYLRAVFRQIIEMFILVLVVVLVLVSVLALALAVDDIVVCTTSVTR